MKSKYIQLAAALLAACTAYGQNPPSLPGVIQGELTLPAYSEWMLTGIHYVAPGATLNIQRGVTIYADTNQEAPALIVTAGGRINAVGTPFSPIVFTADDALDPNIQLDHNDVGLWSGIIILGNAPINADVNNIASGPGIVLRDSIEGITATGRHGLDPAVEASWLLYGGINEDDSSGIMQYVSIRHTGFSLTGIAGDEIQGLTMGGVGRGTVIDNIEIFVSDDDGIEIFGGTVNLSNILIAYAEDDSYDLDQGYRGWVQNMLVLQAAFTDRFGIQRQGDHAGEWDGADTPEENDPRALYYITNATFIGAAVDPANNNNSLPIRIRNGGAAQIWNSAFVTNRGDWIRLENRASNNIVKDAFFNGDTVFKGNMFWNGVVDSLVDSLFVFNAFSPEEQAAALATIRSPENKNQVANPQISVSIDENGKIVVEYPVVWETDSPLFNADNTVATPEGAPIEQVSYVGAFNGVVNWAAWTFAAEQGYFIKRGWIHTPTFGWVLAPEGRLTDTWLYLNSSKQWVWSGPRVHRSGRWLYMR